MNIDHRHGQIRRGLKSSKFELVFCEFAIDVGESSFLLLPTYLSPIYNNIDLREEFHWNTKLIFLWLTAEYEKKF